MGWREKSLRKINQVGEHTFQCLVCIEVIWELIKNQILFGGPDMSTDILHF
jgi:hypothetical protein